MKKVLSLVLVAVMIMTLSSSAIYAAPNNNPNAAFNRSRAAFENKVKNNNLKEGEANELREQLRFTMLNGEGLPYGIGKRLELPPGLQMLFERGTLPYGIAKKLMDNYYPLPGTKTDLEVLEALIVTANSKATAAVPADYKGGLTTINTFKAAIVKAENFVDGYVETQKSMIKIEIDKLKAAMKVFDDLKYMGVQEVNALIIIEARLLDYQEKYEDYLSPAKKLELQNLIDFINTFTRTEDRVKLTKGDYDSILIREKAFKDSLITLYVKIDEAKVMLYKDITDPTEGFKVIIGTDPGEYLSAGVVGLHNAVIVAEKFVADHTTESLYKIEAEVEKQVDALDVAIDTFKDSKVLGADERAILKMTSDQLKDYYKEESIPALAVLIAEIEPFLSVSSVLTVGLYNDFIDRSEEYIEDLYAFVIDEIEVLIEASKTLLDDNAPMNLAEEISLYNKIVEVEAYLLTDVEYDELVTYYSQLNVLFQALQDKLEE